MIMKILLQQILSESPLQQFNYRLAGGEGVGEEQIEIAHHSAEVPTFQ